MSPDSVAEALFEANPVPALSLAVARPGEVIWSKAFGMADIERGIAATPEHLYRLGSVSKVLTSTAAARLVSRGLLELETPIGYWLPGLPPAHRATTLLQLLTHRGGVRHYRPSDLDPSAPDGPITSRRYESNDDFLALFIEDELVAPPGKQVSYSSFGYTLASIVMEAAAGQPFLELMQKEVGRTFGLASLAADDPEEDMPARAQGYIDPFDAQMIARMMPGAAMLGSEGETVPIPYYSSAFCWAGAGFLLSTLDCARFGAALPQSDHNPLSAEERALLFTPLTAKTDASPPLGLGWRIDEDGKGRLRWHHAGATLGGRAGLVIYPELKLAVAINSNVMTRPGDVLAPAEQLVEAFG